MQDVFIHPTALVETQTIGRGTRIWALTHVMHGASIGVECSIGDHCFIEAGVSIGNYVTMKNGNMVWEGVTLEDGVFVGPHVFFTNDLYPRSSRYSLVNRRSAKAEWLVPTLVQRGASLGAGAVLLAGHTIGEFAMVGAGAVVTQDIPPYALVIGNPARVCSWVCLCGLPLSFARGEAHCACERTFARTGDDVRCTSLIE